MTAALAPVDAAMGQTVTLRGQEQQGAGRVPVLVTPVFDGQSFRSPSLVKAVEDLHRYLERMLGSPVAVVHDVKDLTAGALPIDLTGGDASLAALLREKQVGRQGFALRISSEAIHVQGVSDWGTVYGVYELLERMGVRWLFPGQWGEVVPAQGPVVLSEAMVIDQPVFNFRAIHQYSMRAPTQYGQWARRSRLEVSGFSGHSGLILKHRKTHPEWFALVDGKRMNEDRHPKLCHSNDDMVQQAIVEVLETIAQRKQSSRNLNHQIPIAVWREAYVLSISPTDGGGFCRCEPCLAMGTISDRLQIFANTIAQAVAKEHPEYLVGYYGAYSEAQMPPTVKAHPNVVVFATTWQKSFFHPLDSLRNHAFRDKIAAFEPMCPRLAIRDFDGMYGSWWGWGPMSLISTHQQDYPWYRDHGVEGFISEAADHWAAGGQSYYVTVRLWWNPAADVEAIKRDFVEKGFGAAAAPMWRYYEHINREQTALSATTLTQMRHELEEARKLAITDTTRPDVVHRIDMLRVYLLLNDTLGRAQSGDASVDDLRLAVRLGRSITGRNIVGKGMVDVLEKLYLAAANAKPESIAELPPCDEAEQQSVLASMTIADPGPTFPAWASENELRLTPLVDQPDMTTFEPSMGVSVRYGPMTALIYARPGQRVTITQSAAPRPGPLSYELRSPEHNIMDSGVLEADGKLTFTATTGGIHALTIATGGLWTQVHIDSPWAVYRAAGPQDRFHPFRGQTMYFYVPRGTRQFAIVARTFVRERYTLTVWGPHDAPKPILPATVSGDSNFRPYVMDVPPGADGKVWRINLRGDKKEIFLQGVPPYFASSPDRLLILER